MTMRYILLLRVTFAVGLLLHIQPVLAQLKPRTRTVVNAPSDKRKFLIFLLAGQSNMAGRGDVAADDTLGNPRILSLNAAGKWEIAKDPMHTDRSYAGVGPGMSFARTLIQHDTTITIGLIPCAVGGSGINSWLPSPDTLRDGKNFKAAVSKARLAMQSGTIKGILWAQGETDCTALGVSQYETKLIRVVRGFRQKLNMADLAFTAALLPGFQQIQPDKNKQLQENPFVVQINQAIMNLSSKLNNYQYISASETTHKGDHLHYDAESARTMGKRFAVAAIKNLK